MALFHESQTRSLASSYEKKLVIFWPLFLTPFLTPFFTVFPGLGKMAILKFKRHFFTVLAIFPIFRILALFEKSGLQKWPVFCHFWVIFGVQNDPTPKGAPLPPYPKIWGVPPKNDPFWTLFEHPLKKPENPRACVRWKCQNRQKPVKKGVPKVTQNGGTPQILG